MTTSVCIINIYLKSINT